MASNLTNNPLNIESFSGNEIKIFFSDQNDNILMSNADSIPNNSIIFSSNSNGNSILCKDNINIRQFLYKIDNSWFDLDSNGKLKLNEEKLTETINSYIKANIDSIDISKINNVNEYIKNIVKEIIDEYKENNTSLNEEKIFTSTNSFYDTDINKVEPISENPLVFYTDSGDGIYTKPAYFNKGTYKLVLYLDSSSAYSTDLYLYNYKTTYPSKYMNDGDTIEISSIVQTGNKLIAKIKISNKMVDRTFYEYNATIMLPNSGIYSLNIYNSAYRILVP